MSINNKTWAADEEITYSKLNQMTADAVNATDDIHPQYNQYDIDHVGETEMQLVQYVNSADLADAHFTRLGPNGVDIWSRFNAVNGTQIASSRFYFKKLASSPRYLNISFKDIVASSNWPVSPSAFSQLVIRQNGADLYSAQYNIGTGWTTRTYQFDMSVLVNDSHFVVVVNALSNPPVGLSGAGTCDMTIKDVSIIGAN